MLNPLLLWFLPLAVVPVLLHLLNLHRLKEVELPTYRFLMEGYVRQRRRVKLVEWLLLLLRTAVVALVVAALARPIVGRLGGLFGGLLGGGGRDVVFVVDAGMTTGLVSEGTSAIHRIREAARGAAARFGAGDFFTLVRAGMEPRVVHRAVLGDGRRAAAEIDALEPDPGSADLVAALAEALSGPPRGPRTVWIFSDCEARAWKRLAEDQATGRVPADVQLVVVDVGGLAERGGVTNLAVLGDPPRGQRPVVGLPVELSVRIEGAGITGPTETKATVVLDDEMVAQLPLVATPGRVAAGTVAVVPPRPGVLHGRIEIPRDAFPDDDSLLFVLNVEPRVGVLVVAPRGVEPLFDPALFLKLALDSPRDALSAGRGEQGADGAAGRPAATPAADASGIAAIAGSLDVSVVRSDRLDERQVKGADVIVLADPRIDGNRQRWIRSRVEAGAGLVLVAGSHVRGAEPLADLAAQRNPVAPREGLAIRLAAPVGDPADETAGRGLGRIDHSHPVFAPFRGSAAGVAGSALETLVVFRHVPLELPAAPAAAGPGQVREEPREVVLARLDDGTPVVAETRIGRGRVIVSGLAVTPDWSNLPVHPAFVPIMLRAVQHVRPEPPAVAAESVHPYEPAPVRLEAGWRRAVVQATAPGGGTRMIEMVPGDSGATGALDDTRAVGFYEFAVEPPAGQSAAPVRVGMAVNSDVETAAFAPFTGDDVEEAFAPHPVTRLAGTATDPVLHGRLTGRREIWRWLIALVFAFFLADFLLGTLKQPEPGEAGTRRNWRERIADWLGRAVGSGGEMTGT
jgi:hypothetical protein